MSEQNQAPSINSKIHKKQRNKEIKLQTSKPMPTEWPLTNLTVVLVRSRKKKKLKLRQ